MGHNITLNEHCHAFFLSLAPRFYTIYVPDFPRGVLSILDLIYALGSHPKVVLSISALIYALDVYGKEFTFPNYVPLKRFREKIILFLKHNISRRFHLRTKHFHLKIFTCGIRRWDMVLNYYCTFLRR